MGNLKLASHVSNPSPRLLAEERLNLLLALGKRELWRGALGSVGSIHGREHPLKLFGLFEVGAKLFEPGLRLRPSLIKPENHKEPVYKLLYVEYCIWDRAPASAP